MFLVENARLTLAITLVVQLLAQVGLVSLFSQREERRCTTSGGAWGTVTEAVPTRRWHEAGCGMRLARFAGLTDTPKFKDFILPLI
jgi:hypothetical protein